jgi:hypothetical protein
MTEPRENRLPDDLEQVAARLRANRAQADPLQLDHIKQTVMARSSTQPQGSWTFMKSRIAAAASVVALLGGTGGAIAIAGTASSSGPNGGAASGQYKPGKGCGDKNHQHSKNGQCKKGHAAIVAGRHARHVAVKKAKPHRHQGKGAYNHAFNTAYNPAFNQAFNQAWLKEHHQG